MNHRSIYTLSALLLLLAGSALTAEPVYDPLAGLDRPSPRILELKVNDKDRRREIPIRIYLPAERAPSAVVLFSHGLGGSRDGSAFLGMHWAKRGYVAVFLQHPGSDTSIWKDKPLWKRFTAMKQAAGAKNFLLRVKDVPAVLDQLDRWNKTAGHALEARLDLQKVGMSGHSFGAVTTQAVSGQSIGLGLAPYTDPRIRAAIALSPSSPAWGGNPKQAFGAVKIPWMLMTGTEDLALIGNADMNFRLAVFPALPPGGKYEVVLHRAEHSAFTERALPGDAEKRNPNHHRAILALSTAFWDTYLKKHEAAATWLDGDGPRSILERDDRWQKK